MILDSVYYGELAKKHNSALTEAEAEYMHKCLFCAPYRIKDSKFEQVLDATYIDSSEGFYITYELIKDSLGREFYAHVHNNERLFVAYKGKLI